MNEFGLKESDMECLTDVFEQFAFLEEAILFGSRAMGNYKQGSDIDLAVKMTKKRENSVKLIHLALEEGIPLPYFFNVVNYDTIENKELIRHIDEEGKTIYKKRK